VATAKERILLYCKSADAETAKELKNIVSSLPDKGADKTTINNFISKLIAVLDNDIEKYLTADLNSAIRAMNMAKTSNSGSSDNPDRDPVVEDTESNSEMTESTMENTESNNENTEINSEDTEIDSDNMESNITDETESATDSDFEQSTDNSNKKLEFPIISITCAIIIILVVIIVIAIILKNRKNNNQITE
jgi:cobalamin biosynthesis Mg chelatase CobN